MILIDVKKGNVYGNLMRFSSFLTNKVYEYEEKHKKSVKKILLTRKINSDEKIESYFLDCRDEYVDIFTFFTPDLFNSYDNIFIEINSSNEIVIRLLNNDIELVYNIYLINSLKYIELKDLDGITNKELKDVNTLKKSRRKMLLIFDNIYDGIDDSIINQFKKDNLSLDYSLDEGINWAKLHSGNNLESETFKKAMYRLSYI